MTFAIILGAVVAIIIWVFVGKEFQNIAEMKGHDERKYFWWSFLLGPVGMLMVIALPDYNMVAVIQKYAEEEEKRIQTGVKIISEDFTKRETETRQKEAEERKRREEDVRIEAKRKAEAEAEKMESELKDMTLVSQLKYAMRFSSEQGARGYLERVLSKLDSEEQDILTRLLDTPEGQLRTNIDKYMKSIQNK